MNKILTKKLRKIINKLENSKRIKKSPLIGTLDPTILMNGDFILQMDLVTLIHNYADPEILIIIFTEIRVNHTKFKTTVESAIADLVKADSNKPDNQKTFFILFSMWVVSKNKLGVDQSA